MTERETTYAEASQALQDALADVASLSITVTGRGDDAIPITLNWQVNEWHTATAELEQETRPQLELVQLNSLTPPTARPTVCRYTDLNLTFKVRPAYEPPLGPDVTEERR
jgi:hypothetical protein